MDAAALQARIDAIPWYHEFDFGNGLKARTSSDAEVHRRFWRFIEVQLATIDFQGKSVLDIGCWDGYWSFYAEKRGAREVLASDDLSQNWAASEGLSLAKELLKSKVQTNTRLSVYDAASLGRTFDVILFLGVYYHLFDPLYALAQVRHCCHPKTVVCIEGNEGIGMPNNAAIFDPFTTGGKFLPDAGHLQRLFQSAYLTVAAKQSMVGAGLAPPEVRLGWRWRLRMCWKALGGERTGVLAAADEIRNVGDAQRVFYSCTPFDGENPVHQYRPPFGLHKFDPRFRDGTGPS